jgi:pentatricopeptide repeat protein
MSDIKWSYEEFTSFLLIYIANVDMEFAEEEKAMIRSYAGEEIFEKMVEIFDSMSDFKAYETIMSYKEVYYSTAEEKQKLVEKMQDLFDADAEFNIMEKELLHFLERMM